MRTIKVAEKEEQKEGPEGRDWGDLTPASTNALTSEGIQSAGEETCMSSRDDEQRLLSVRVMVPAVDATREVNTREFYQGRMISMRKGTTKKRAASEAQVFFL